MSVGLLYDSTCCIGCGACSTACKEQNKLPGPVDDVNTAYTWTTVHPHGDAFMRTFCMHCETPTCASVCPVGALQKTPDGPVVYDASKCIGCRYCVQACPFDIPKYQWDRPVPVMGKCILCADRVKAGRPTACAEICPVQATVFGTRENLLWEARNRIRKNPGKYLNQIYGLQEVGGTSVMMLAGMPLQDLGLNPALPKEPPAMKTWQVLSKVPDFVAVWAVFLYGVHWITARREVVARVEKEDRSSSKKGGRS